MYPSAKCFDVTSDATCSLGLGQGNQCKWHLMQLLYMRDVAAAGTQPKWGFSGMHNGSLMGWHVRPAATTPDRLQIKTPACYALACRWRHKQAVRWQGATRHYRTTAWDNSSAKNVPPFQPAHSGDCDTPPTHVAARCCDAAGPSMLPARDQEPGDRAATCLVSERAGGRVALAGHTMALEGRGEVFSACGRMGWGRRPGSPSAPQRWR